MLTYPNIRLVIEEDYEAVSKRAALHFAKAVKNNPKRAFGFATGSTPIGLYQELIRMHKEDGLDFSGITSFNLDEYHPIDPDSEQSYRHFMDHHLFSHINIPKDRTFIPNGQADDPEEEAKGYGAKLNEVSSCGGLVLQVLGIGLNGHIGFNEPSNSFAAETRYVPLAELTITSNSKFFPDPDKMPRHAITMGIRDIMLAEQLILLVTGSAKANILRDALLGPITPLVPASILQLHPDVIVAADKEAASLL